MSLLERFKDVGVTEVPKIMKKKKTTRGDRAMDIVKRHQLAMSLNKPPIIIQTSKNTIGVASTSRVEHSELTLRFGVWVCDCPDTRMHGGECKHLIAIMFCKLRLIKIPTFDEAMEMTNED